MIAVELLGGPRDGLQGFVAEPQEVLLVKDQHSQVDAYEWNGGMLEGRRIYRFARHVGRMGVPSAPQVEPEGGSGV